MKIWRHIAREGSLRTILLAGAVSVAVISLSACQGTTAADRGNPPPPAVTATISFCDDGTPDCAAETSFAVGTLRDLVIKVVWENLPAGNHTQTLEVLLPAGGQYQVTQSAFNPGSASLNSFTTTRVLPVAGTWIPQRQIVGDWVVRVSLDGQVVASQMVTLNP
jgi:hypothetical protein